MTGIRGRRGGHGESYWRSNDTRRCQRAVSETRSAQRINELHGEMVVAATKGQGHRWCSQAVSEELCVNQVERPGNDGRKIRPGNARGPFSEGWAITWAFIRSRSSILSLAFLAHIDTDETVSCGQAGAPV